MTAPTFQKPSQAGGPATADPDPLMPLAERHAAILQDRIWQASLTSSRSLQAAVGPSELGGLCDRQLTYRLHHTPGVPAGDPWAALVGTALHGWLADLHRRLDAGSGRYLIEHPVEYRGIQGSVDLYDRVTRTAIDWKTSRLAKIRRIGRGGPPNRAHLWQIQTYAAGLAAAGERPALLLIVYLPVDGALSEMRCRAVIPDRAIAHQAVDRLEQLRRHADPTLAAPTSGPLCGWCRYHHICPDSATKEH